MSFFNDAKNFFSDASEEIQEGLASVLEGKKEANETSNEIDNIVQGNQPPVNTFNQTKPTPVVPDVEPIKTTTPKASQSQNNNQTDTKGPVRREESKGRKQAQTAEEAFLQPIKQNKQESEQDFQTKFIGKPPENEFTFEDDQRQDKLEEKQRQAEQIAAETPTASILSTPEGATSAALELGQIEAGEKESFFERDVENIVEDDSLNYRDKVEQLSQTFEVKQTETQAKEARAKSIRKEKEENTNVQEVARAVADTVRKKGFKEFGEINRKEDGSRDMGLLEEFTFDLTSEQGREKAKNTGLNLARGFLESVAGIQELSGAAIQGIDNLIPAEKAVDRFVPGSPNKFIADVMASNPYMAGNVDKDNPNAIASFVRGVSDYITEYSKELGKDQTVEWRNGDYGKLMENDATAAYIASELAPFIVSVVAGGKGLSSVSGLSKSKAASISSGLLESGYAARDAKQQGASLSEEMLASVATGIVTGLTEYPVMSKIFDSVPGSKSSLASNMIQNFAGEGSQEIIQESAGNTIAKFIYDHDREIFNNMAEVGLLGGLGGVGVGGVNAATAKGFKEARPQTFAYHKTDFDVDTTPSFQEATQAAKNKEVSNFKQAIKTKENAQTYIENKKQELDNTEDQSQKDQIKAQIETAEATVSTLPSEKEFSSGKRETIDGNLRQQAVENDNFQQYKEAVKTQENAQERLNLLKNTDLNKVESSQSKENIKREIELAQVAKDDLPSRVFGTQQNPELGEAVYLNNQPQPTSQNQQQFVGDVQNAELFDASDVDKRQDFVEKMNANNISEAVRKSKEFDGFFVKEQNGETSIGITNPQKINKVGVKRLVSTQDLQRQTKDVFGVNLTQEQVKETFAKYFDDSEVEVEFVDNITSKDGQEAYGKFDAHRQVVTFAKNPDLSTPAHEAVHAYMEIFQDEAGRRKVLDKIKEESDNALTDTEAEEVLAERFIKHIREKNNPEGIVKDLFDRTKQGINKLFGRVNEIDQFYEDIINKKRPESRSPEETALVNNLARKRQLFQKQPPDTSINTEKLLKSFNSQKINRNKLKDALKTQENAVDFVTQVQNGERNIPKDNQEIIEAVDDVREDLPTEEEFVQQEEQDEFVQMFGEDIAEDIVGESDNQGEKDIFEKVRDELGSDAHTNKVKFEVLKRMDSIRLQQALRIKESRGDLMNAVDGHRYASDSEFTNGFTSFVELLKHPKLNKGRPKEIMSNMDATAVKSLLRNKNIYDKEWEIESIFENQSSLTENEALQLFREIVEQHDPGLLAGRKAQNRLDLSTAADQETLSDFTQYEIERELNRRAEEGEAEYDMEITNDEMLNKESVPMSEQAKNAREFLDVEINNSVKHMTLKDSQKLQDEVLFQEKFDNFVEEVTQAESVELSSDAVQSQINQAFDRKTKPTFDNIKKQLDEIPNKVLERAKKKSGYDNVAIETQHKFNIFQRNISQDNTQFKYNEEKDKISIVDFNGNEKTLSSNEMANLGQEIIKQIQDQFNKGRKIERLKQLVEAGGKGPTVLTMGPGIDNVDQIETVKTPEGVPDVPVSREWKKNLFELDDLPQGKVPILSNAQQKFEPTVFTATRAGEDFRKMFFHQMNRATDRSAKKLKKQRKKFRELTDGMGGVESSRIYVKALAKEPDIETKKYKDLTESQKKKAGRIKGLFQKTGDKIKQAATTDEVVTDLFSDSEKFVVLADKVVKVPELSKAENRVLEYGRQMYDKWIDEMNAQRRFMGKDAIPKRENYVTHMRELGQLRGQGESLVNQDKKSIDEAVNKFNDEFKWNQERKGETSDLKLDYFHNFLNYQEHAVKYQHVIPLANAFKRVIDSEMKHPETGEPVKFSEENPNLTKFMRGWLDHLSGTNKTSFELDHPWAAKIINKVSNQLSPFFLTNLRSSTIQASAIAPVIAETNSNSVRKGIQETLKHPTTAIEKAEKKSNVISARQFDILANEISKNMGLDVDGVTDMGKLKDKLGQTLNDLNRLGLKPLQAIDSITATVSWWSAYKHAKDKNIDEQEAIEFADEVVLKTQSSSERSQVAPVQRSFGGKQLTKLNTFIIANSNLIKRQAARATGLANEVDDFSKLKAAKWFLSTFVAYGLTNVMFEDIFNINAPFPRPMKKFYDGVRTAPDPDKITEVAKEAGIDPTSKEFRRNESIQKRIAQGSVNSAKEITELVPVAGGFLKYGPEQVAGPSIGYGLTIASYFAGDPTAPSGIDAWTRLVAPVGGAGGGAIKEAVEDYTGLTDGIRVSGGGTEFKAIPSDKTTTVVDNAHSAEDIRSLKNTLKKRGNVKDRLVTEALSDEGPSADTVVDMIEYNNEIVSKLTTKLTRDELPEIHTTKDFTNLLKRVTISGSGDVMQNVKNAKQTQVVEAVIDVAEQNNDNIDKEKIRAQLKQKLNER